MRDENKARLKYEEQQREKEKKRLKEKDKRYCSGFDEESKIQSNNIKIWETTGVSGTCEHDEAIRIGPLVVEYGNGMSVVTGGSRIIGTCDR